MRNQLKQPLILLLYVLTFTTGLVDSVSILGLGGVFTSLMTGNTVLIGLSLGGGADYASAFRSALSILFFMFGAAFAGRWAKRRMKLSYRAWLLPIACGESGLLLMAAAVGYLFGGSSGALPRETALTMIGLTAMAMGLRGATVLRLAVPDMKTTVLTLTLTGLAADSPLGGNRSQLALRRISSVVVLSSGALVGALLYNQWGVTVPLAIMAVVVFASTLAFSLTAQAKGHYKKD